MEATIGNIGSEFDEEAFDLPEFETPQFELAKAWGVDDVAAELEVEEFGEGGCVFSFASPVGDFADAEAEAWFDGVEERTLADAGLAGDGGCAGGEEFFEAVEALWCSRGGDEDFVAELGIETDDPLKIGEVDEVGFVEDDDGWDGAHFGGDEVSIDEGWFEGWICERGDDDQAVDIGGDDVGASAIASDDDAFAWFDPFDHALFEAAFSEEYAIADGDDAAFVDGHGFEESADAASIVSAVVGGDDGFESVDSNDASGVAFGGIDDGGGVVVSVEGGVGIGDDGAFAGEVAASADAFGGGRILDGVFGVASREVVGSGSIFAIFA
jgi:hypothetical protein